MCILHVNAMGIPKKKTRMGNHHEYESNDNFMGILEEWDTSTNYMLDII